MTSEDTPDTPRKRRVFSSDGWVRRFARLWGFLGFVLLVVVLSRHVILPFVFALLLAFILAPLIERMSVRANGERRMHRGLAIVLCYIAILTGVTAFGLVVIPRVSSDVARIAKEAPVAYDRLNKVWAPKAAQWIEDRLPSAKVGRVEDSRPKSRHHLGLPEDTAAVLTPLPDGRFAVQLPEAGVMVRQVETGFQIVSNVPGAAPKTQDSLRARINSWTQGLSQYVSGEINSLIRLGRALVVGLARGVFGFFVVLMVCAFVLIDLKKIHAFFRGLVPEDYRSDYDVIASGIDRSLSGVIRGQLVICLVNGVVTYIGLVIFDVKYAPILAVVAMVLSLIPVFGSIVSTIPIVLAALVSGDAGVDVARAVCILAWIACIHFIEANLLNPKILGDAAKIHPILVIFSLLVGEHLYGLVGALLAVPAAGIIQVFFVYFRTKAWQKDPRVIDSTGTAAE